MGGFLRRFITSLIDVPDYSVQLNFGFYAREIMRKTIDAFPEIVWQVYTEQIISNGPYKAHRLSELFGADFGDPSHAGVLDLMPMSIVEPWMLEDRPGRLPIVLEWINIFESTELAANWDPEFISFIEQHVREADEMNPIALRLTTGSWFGSYASKLRPELERVVQLGKVVSNPAVSRWVAQMRQYLIRKIECARRDDDNRDVKFRA
jgi:hypothetical protein